MRKTIAIVFLVLGMLLVLGVMVAGADEAPLPAANTVAQTPPEGATYVGSDTCFGCHSQNYRQQQLMLHPHMVGDAVADPSVILADFSSGEDVRMVDSLVRAYTADDVALTLGNKDRQRYVMATDDGGMMVLPGQWNIASGEWVAMDAADWLNDCAGCHTTGFNANDHSYTEAGISCEACHGPGSAHVELTTALPLGGDPLSDEVYAAREAIVKTVDSAVCGQCHNLGISPDGEHGYAVGYQPGGDLSAAITLAESSGEADDPNFWLDGHEKSYRGQYNAWSQSRHGNALATLQANDHAGDSCLACHSTDYLHQGSPFPQDAPVTMENAQFSITCVNCHAPHGEQSIENQLADEAYNLCVSCHTGTGNGNTVIQVGGTVHHPMREMFEGISFLDLDPHPSPHFSNEAYGPICSSCHMVATATDGGTGTVASHTWKLVMPGEAAEGEPDSCTQCHSIERSADNTPENLQFAIDSVQRDTRERVDDLNAELEQINADHPEWDASAEDKSAEQQMAERIHTLVSFVESDGSEGFHNPAYTDDILSEAEDTLDDLLDKLAPE